MNYYAQRLLSLSVLLILMPAGLCAETCTTQSAMAPAVRDGLLSAAQNIATLSAANNADGVKALTMPQVAADFGGIAQSIRDASSHMQGAGFVPQSVWLLDNSAAPVGSQQDAQFFCNLNRGSAMTSFMIPSLPQGKYGLVVLDATGPDPWQVSTLLRENTPGQWQLAGFFPRATTTAGHDGLWYWKTARDYVAKKQAWNAWIYYAAAEQLLKPVSFVSSDHLEKLQGERSKAAPPALSNGLNEQQPLVIGDGKGAEIRVTALAAENAPANAGLDVVAHVKADNALNDPIASRARNQAAAKAIVAAYPELRSAFHGVWIMAEFPDGSNYISEEPMSSL